MRGGRESDPPVTLALENKEDQSAERTLLPPLGNAA